MESGVDVWIWWSLLTTKDIVITLLIYSFPMVEEKLPLYLVASSTTIVLTRKDNQLHLSIYHMSKVLSDVKTMYSPLEKVNICSCKKTTSLFPNLYNGNLNGISIQNSTIESWHVKKMDKVVNWAWRIRGSL